MKNRFSFFVVSFLLLVAQSAWAHEFLAVPVQTEAAKNQVVPFRVMSTHVMMISEEVEAPDTVSATLYNGKDKKDLKLMENNMLFSLDGQIAPKNKGAGLIAVHRKATIWTQTADGWKKGPKSAFKKVVSSGKYEKFCKSLVQVGDSSKGYDRVTGDLLEIVPVDDPTKAKVNDEIAFRFLYNGKPYSPSQVLATYNGFSALKNTFAYRTTPAGQGIAKIKITHPGTWVVLIKKTNNKGTKEYDKHVIKAAYVFGVK